MTNDSSFEACLDQAINTLGGAETEDPPKVPVAARRRRAWTPDDYSRLATLTLVEDEGMLRWVYSPPPRRSGRRRALRRSIPAVDGNPIRTIRIQDLPKNQVLQGIAGLDQKLTPDQGLRIWRGGMLQKIAKSKIAGKRVLLLVHGTFSKSDMFFEQFQATPAGKQLLIDLENTYDAILAFDHATLSVSPWINALDLDAALVGVSGKIDVVSHSRGGLVTAWWLRMATRNVRNVMFVGSPLIGTSLASPAALRQALDHLATAAKAIAATAGMASTVLPLMTVVTGIAKTLGGVLQLGADLPIADAAVVTIPGLASQSRVSNNAEMLRLFASPWPTRPQFHAVIGNFRPVESDAGWRFWRRLTNVGDQLKYGAADLIFDGPNDLVVDTGSMQGPMDGDRSGPGLDALARLAFDTRVTMFNDSPTVHHTNYFRQPETINAMRALL
jgi:pimeloyl-ACP methyl ester carboxylesterase